MRGRGVGHHQFITSLAAVAEPPNPAFDVPEHRSLEAEMGQCGEPGTRETPLDRAAADITLDGDDCLRRRPFGDFDVEWRAELRDVIAISSTPGEHPEAIAIEAPYGRVVEDAAVIAQQQRIGDATRPQRIEATSLQRIDACQGLGSPNGDAAHERKIEYSARATRGQVLAARVAETARRRNARGKFDVLPAAAREP